MAKKIIITIDSTGLIPKVMNEIQIALNIGTGVGVAYLRKKFEERLSTRYYSLAQLRAMGHPYARRLFTAFNRKRKLPSLKHPIEKRIGTSVRRVLAYGRVSKLKVRTDIINRQSGRLLKSVTSYSSAYKIKPPYNKLRAIGYVAIPNKIRYARYVFEGTTSRLIPRPIHLIVAKREQFNVAKVIEKEMAKYLNATQGSIFGD